MIELALTLASAADIAFVNRIHQRIIPFQISAQEASGISNFAFGGLKSFETKFFSRRTDGGAERRGTVVVGLLTSPAGRTSPDGIFKFFKGGDIPFHVNLHSVEPKMSNAKAQISNGIWNLGICHWFDIWILTFGPYV
jgi:hypothetical protein